MRYLVRMDVNIPTTMPADEKAALVAAEKEFSQAAQRDGRIAHIWRVAGEWANYSVIDVAGNDELHELLSAFPLFPCMKMQVTPLAQHPNAIA